MRITWNAAENRFEAELTPGNLWSQDQQAAQISGFRTTGPPAWTWYATKAAVLTKLRLNKPSSGLTITTEALKEYNRLKSVEDLNETVKAQLKQAKKAIQKEKKTAPITDEVQAVREGLIPEYWRGKSSVTRDDLPPECFLEFSMPEYPFAGPLCHGCNDPICQFEIQNPPTCLWCEMHPEESLEIGSGTLNKGII